MTEPAITQASAGATPSGPGAAARRRVQRRQARLQRLRPAPVAARRATARPARTARGAATARRASTRCSSRGERRAFGQPGVRRRRIVGARGGRVRQQAQRGDRTATRVSFMASPPAVGRRLGPRRLGRQLGQARFDQLGQLDQLPRLRALRRRRRSSTRPRRVRAPGRRAPAIAARTGAERGVADLVGRLGVGQRAHQLAKLDLGRGGAEAPDPQPDVVALRLARRLEVPAVVELRRRQIRRACRPRTCRRSRSRRGSRRRTAASRCRAGPPWWRPPGPTARPRPPRPPAPAGPRARAPRPAAPRPPPCARAAPPPRNTTCSAWRSVGCQRSSRTRLPRWLKSRRASRPGNRRSLRHATWPRW